MISCFWPRAPVGIARVAASEGPARPTDAFPIPLDRQILARKLALSRAMTFPFGPSLAERSRLVRALHALGPTSINGLAAALSWSPRKTEKLVNTLARRGEGGVWYTPSLGEGPDRPSPPVSRSVVELIGRRGPPRRRSPRDGHRGLAHCAEDLTDSTIPGPADVARWPQVSEMRRHHGAPRRSRIPRLPEMWKALPGSPSDPSPEHVGVLRCFVLGARPRSGPSVPGDARGLRDRPPDPVPPMRGPHFATLVSVRSGALRAGRA